MLNRYPTTHTAHTGFSGVVALPTPDSQVLVLVGGVGDVVLGTGAGGVALCLGVPLQAHRHGRVHLGGREITDFLLGNLVQVEYYREGTPWW